MDEFELKSLLIYFYYELISGSFLSISLLLKNFF